MAQTENHKQNPEELKEEVKTQAAEEVLAAEPTEDTAANDSQLESEIVEEESAKQEEETEQSPEERILELEVALKEAQEDRLRAIADGQNLRRRTQREVENARKYAAEPLARNLLSVIDNLQRALEAVPADKAESDQDLKNLRIGVEMTNKEFEQAFAKASIERLYPLDEAFDPNLHQAMFEILDPDSEPGTVKTVVTAGYKLHDRLLRAAMVGVTKKT